MFSLLNPEKIWHEHLTDLSTSPVRCRHFTLGNPKKSFSAVSLIHTSDYLRYLGRKQAVTHLSNPREKVTTLTCEMQNFSSDWRFVAFLQMLVALKRASCGLALVALKEPVVMCGNWNVTQATSQQVFRVVTFCMDACFQCFSLLISCIVHHVMLKFSPCLNKLQPQLFRITDWYSIHALL